jgi:DNA-binding MarR family transcriptional regulator
MNTSRAGSDHAEELRALLLAGHRFRQALAEHFGVSMSETVVLGHLALAQGRLTPSELMRITLLGSGTLTAVVDRLVADGYAERRPDADDRRRVQIVLTPSGRRVVRSVQARMRNALATAGEEVSATTLGQLTAALDAETARVQLARR